MRADLLETCIFWRTHLLDYFILREFDQQSRVILSSHLILFIRWLNLSSRSSIECEKVLTQWRITKRARHYHMWEYHWRHEQLCACPHYRFYALGFLYPLRSLFSWNLSFVCRNLWIFVFCILFGLRCQDAEKAQEHSRRARKEVNSNSYCEIKIKII